MRKIADDIWEWSVFSNDKQLDFNGLWILVRGHDGDTPLLIDPPPLKSAVMQSIEQLGAPKQILLTNKDHRRHAPQARERFGAAIWIHERDKPLIDCDIDQTFSDGDVIAETLEVLPIPDAKSPGESALYWRERRVLILGDALIGKPAGSLSLLPDEKFADPALARKGASRLAELDVDVVLVGDGTSIVERGGEVIRRFVESR